MLFFKKKIQDKFLLGLISGLILAILFTVIIISINSEKVPVWDYFTHFFDKGVNAQVLRTGLLVSLKGGILADLPLFFLFLNRKMYRSVKGLMTGVLLLALFFMLGYFVL